MSQIFVSYRRVDSPGTAGRLVDHLSRHFGADEVFRDIDSIEAGEDFDQAIRDALAGATAALILIGPRWLDARKEDGSRRLDDPHDYVRREIELALRSTTRVVPVLVDDARMPAPNALPDSLHELATRQAFEVTDRHWRHDAHDLVRQLDDWIAPDRPREHESLGRVALDTLSGFAPDLFSILRRPREFLRRRTLGRRADLLRALVFFATAVLLATTMLISVYTPRESVVGFLLSALVAGFLLTVLLSGPLWIGWRAVGATQHYSRAIVILLYQMAVLHVALFVVAWIILAALDWQSSNVVRAAMDRGLQLKSGAAAIRSITGELLPLAEAGGVRLAITTAAMVIVAAAIWMLRAWGAYRDAFKLSRGRAAAASLVAVLVAWIGAMLANAVVYFRR